MSLSFNTASEDVVWLKNAKVSFFPIFSKKIKDRLKICSTVGVLLEEFADLEQSMGKNLTKSYEGNRYILSNVILSGSNAQQLQQPIKSESFPNFHLASQHLLKSSSAIKGKLHLSFHLTLSLNICKAFPDHVKSANKTISSFINKIQSSCDEIRKAKQGYYKKNEKYIKLIHETEMAIKARDDMANAIEGNNNNVNNGGGGKYKKGQDVGGEVGSGGAGDGLSQSSLSSLVESNHSTASAFVNRSLNKVKAMTKMTQEDSLKRLNDKVKDLLVDIDTQENLLSATCLKLQSDQYQLREDVTRAMVELKVLEESNFLLMKDSYSNLCIGLELFVSRFFETMATVEREVNIIESTYNNNANSNVNAGNNNIKSGDNDVKNGDFKKNISSSNDNNNNASMMEKDAGSDDDDSGDDNGNGNRHNNDEDDDDGDDNGNGGDVLNSPVKRNIRSATATSAIGNEYDNSYDTATSRSTTEVSASVSSDISSSNNNNSKDYTVTLADIDNKNTNDTTLDSPSRMHRAPTATSLSTTSDSATEDTSTTTTALPISTRSSTSLSASFDESNVGNEASVAVSTAAVRTDSVEYDGYEIRNSKSTSTSAATTNIAPIPLSALSKIDLNDSSFDSLFIIIDDISERFEAIKNTLQRLVNGLTECMETERVYFKNMNKILVKHGYSMMTNNNANNNPTNSQSHMLSVLVSELLLDIIASPLRLAVDISMQTFSKLGMAHANIQETVSKEILDSLNPVITRLQSCRELLLDKKLTLSKSDYNSRYKVLKLQQKLTKNRINLEYKRNEFLTEKNNLSINTISTTENPLTNNNGVGGVADSDTASYSTDEFESPSNNDNIVNNSTLSPINNSTSINANSSTGGHSALAKSLAVDLAIAVGLETPQEKIQRIENKITELEKTETETLNNLTIALQENEKIVVQGTDEIQSLLAYAQQIISVELCATKATYQTLVECQRDVLYDIKECNHNMETAWANVQPKNEFMTLYEHDVNHYNRINPILLHSSTTQPLQALQQILLDEKDLNNNNIKDTTNNVVTVSRTSTGTDFSSMTNAALDMMLNSGSSSGGIDSSSSLSNSFANGIESADITPLADFHTINSDLIQGERQSRLQAAATSSANNTLATPIATIAPSASVTSRIGSSGDSTTATSFPANECNRSKSPLANTSPGRRKSLLSTMASSMGRSNNTGFKSLSPLRSSQSKSPPTEISAATAVPIVASSPSPTLSQSQTKITEPTAIINQSQQNLHQSQSTAAAMPTLSQSMSRSIAVSHTDNNNTINSNRNDLSISKEKDQQQLQQQNELIKFGLSAQDKVIESFSCALYSRKGLGLTHGRMYVTKFFLAYQGWPETRLLLALTRITSFEKMNTLYYIPNAILIKEKSEEYFFGSFIDRDVCYTLLMNIAAVARTIDDINIRESAATAAEHNNNSIIHNSQQSLAISQVSTVNNMNNSATNNNSNNISNSHYDSNKNNNAANSGWENEERYAHLKFGIQKDGVSDILTDIQTLTSSAVKTSVDNNNNNTNNSYSSTSMSSRAIGVSTMSLNSSVNNSRTNSARNINDSSTSEVNDYGNSPMKSRAMMMNTSTSINSINGGGGMMLDRIESVGDMENSKDSEGSSNSNNQQHTSSSSNSTEDEDRRSSSYDSDGGNVNNTSSTTQHKSHHHQKQQHKPHSSANHHHHHTTAADFKHVGKAVLAATALTTATSAQPPIKPHHSRKRGTSNATNAGAGTFAATSDNNASATTVATTNIATISSITSTTATRRQQSHSSSLPPFDFKKDCIKRSVDLLIPQAVLNVDVCDVYDYMWKNASGYCGFLENQGDLDISGDEWVPVSSTGSNNNNSNNNNNNALPIEDVCKFPFTHKRQCKYSHPRTTMLFIGPKNAPATQTHYLCTDINLNMNVNNSNNNTSDNSCSDGVGNYSLVLTITQFEGIPMADCFKVLQYWYFQHINNSNNSNNNDSSTSTTPTTSSSSTQVTVGLYVHYIKSIMLKGQVSSGVKEELLVMSKKWLTYAQDTIQSKIVDITSSTLTQISTNTTTATNTTAIASAREQQQSVILGGGDTSSDEILVRTDGLVQSSYITASTNTSTSNRTSRVNSKVPPHITSSSSRETSSTTASVTSIESSKTTTIRILMISLVLLLLIFIFLQFSSQYLLMKGIFNINQKLNQLDGRIQQIINNQQQQLLKSSSS